MPEVAPSPPLPITALDRLSPSSDREPIDEILGAVFSKARRHGANPHLHPILDRAEAFVLRGGKRLRPRLTLASYRIVRGSSAAPPRSAWLAATSLELFHAFMLAHDDLIDDSLSRRGEPTLHEAIRLGMGGSSSLVGRKRSNDLGLVCGDLLCALGQGLLARAGLCPETFLLASRLVADMLLETGLGEALDILYDGVPLSRLTESALLDAYTRKTARYSVSGPLVLGAILAGASSETREALDRFGDRLGLGYQIQNDLEPLTVNPDLPNTDLDSGKRTLLLWEAYRGLNPAGRRTMAEALDAPAGEARRRDLLSLITSSGAVDACRRRIADLRADANEALRLSDLDAERRRAFLALAQLLPQQSSCPDSIPSREGVRVP